MKRGVPESSYMHSLEAFLAHIFRFFNVEILLQKEKKLKKSQNFQHIKNFKSRDSGFVAHSFLRILIFPIVFT